MAWQPPALRPAPLNQQWCICDDLSFARIIPSNDRASIEAAFLAEQKEEGNLCQRHGKFFHAKNVSSTVAHTVTGSYSASEIEDDSSNSWESHYGLNLADLSPQAPPLTFRIGSGTSDKSKEDNDVDILTSYPGRGTHRVASIHCAITFGSSGVCLIKALSSVQPTILFIDNEPLTLTLGETHVLCYRTNRFMVGRLEYTFVYNKLGKDAYVAYTDQRNTLYKTLGVSLPDSRVWEFPSSGETRIHGPAIMQVGDGGGFSESVRVGVHARTGQPLAIKSLKIGANQKWNDIIDGVQALLSFQGARGLLQALEVRCAHGHHVDHEEVTKQEGILLPFCSAKHDTIELISSLARFNFYEYGSAKWAEKSTPFKVRVLRDVLEGLKTLHAGGFMHRGISEHSLLIVSEDPPVAVIGNFERSIEAKTSVDWQIGSAYIRAPEMNGSVYGTAVDIWNLAFVAMSMFFPLAYITATNFDAVQETTWYTKMYTQLDVFRLGGDVEALIERVLRAMLDHDPGKRPTAVQALAHLPDFDWERMVYEDLPTVLDMTPETPSKRKAAGVLLDEPSRKVQKQTDDGDAALSSEEDDGEDLGDSDDSKSNDQDQLYSDLMALSSISPNRDFHQFLKTIPPTIDDADAALSSGAGDEEDIEDEDESESNKHDRLDSALNVLRGLPPNSNLHVLLEAMPDKVALNDLISHCEGKDAQLIRRMLQGKKELKKLLGLEIPSDNENDSSISARPTCKFDDSGADPKTSACQRGHKGVTSLITSNPMDQKPGGGTLRDETGDEFKKTSQATDQISTGPEIMERGPGGETQYISLEDSEEEEALRPDSPDSR